MILLCMFGESGSVRAPPVEASRPQSSRLWCGDMGTVFPRCRLYFAMAQLPGIHLAGMLGAPSVVWCTADFYRTVCLLDFSLYCVGGPTAPSFRGSSVRLLD